MNTTRSLITIFTNLLILTLYIPDLSAQVVCKSIMVPAPPVNVIADFTAPDTVCAGTRVNITNLSTNGETFYWSFCTGDTLSNPSGKNIGNPGNMLNIPGYCTLVKEGTTCYSFVTNQGSKSVVRYNHGTSFSNNPISWTDLGGFGLLNDTVMGIKIRYDNGQWIGIVTNNNRLVRLNFGTSLANTPAATLLGPYSMIYVGRGLEIIQEGSTWLGFLTSTLTNRMIRLNFGNSLLNAPVLTDLGALGAMNNPTAIQFLNEDGTWYCMVVNNGNNTITRLTFGNSLLNSPAGVNIGTACPSLSPPGAITLIRDCEKITGFQLHYSTSSSNLIWRLNLPSGITGPIAGTSLGNIGSLSRPNTFSELFRSGDTLFLYAVNRQNFTLTRLYFLPCSSPSAPSSVLFNPPSYSYSLPGTYMIRLIVNEGMPSQASLCKQIVVIDQPSNGYVDTTLCYGTPWHAGGAWQTQPGIYYDTIHVPEACDSIIQTTLRYKPRIPVSLGNDTIMCNNQQIILNPGVDSAGYQWQDGSTDSTYTAFSPGTYWVIVKKDGCSASDSIRIGECVSPLWFPNVFTPNGDRINDTFHPVGNGITRFNVLIYNRWGEKIFESDAMEPGWDGTINGEMCSDGVYLFIATYETDQVSVETYHANGSVTILR